MSKKYNALTYIDEVHAVGLYGKTGGGITEELNLQNHIDIIQGTLAKAFGVMGGYITGNKEIIDFIRSNASGFIFTTSLPPCIAAGAYTAMRHLKFSNFEREQQAKVVNNFQILSIAQITAEALTLAQKLNLELDVFKEVNAGTTANNGQFHINFMSKVLKNDVEPGFTIDLAHKDMGLAIEAGNDFRVGLPVGSSVQAVYGQARSSEFSKKDFSALLDYACQIAEIKPPRLT